MDDGHKSGLYRWQRQSKPKVHSRSYSIKSKTDIQDWIKKVTDASDKAADAAFGLEPSGRERGKTAAKLVSRNVREHEDTYSEAQELLTQWVNDKLHFEDDDGFDDLEAWRRKREMTSANNNAKASQRDSGVFNWDAVIGDDDVQIDEAAIYARIKRAAVGEEDPYAGLYEMEDDEAVSSVMKNMMKKDIVKETFRKDLGFDDRPRTDPRTKMELRHQMVRENREKRQKEEEKRKTAAQLRKEARLRAQQMINQEQKAKESKLKKEEMQTKKEMAKIRKELQEELRVKEDTLKREAEEKHLMERMAQEELQRQQEEEEKAALVAMRRESSRRQQHLVKVEIFKAKQAARNMKTLHKHFTAWYDVILSKRLLLGKVKAMSDWKVMVRVWNAWRSHIRARHVDFETEVHERNIIDSQRKAYAADRHHHHHLLRSTLHAWRRYVVESRDRALIQSRQDAIRGKMVSLLSAVAERGKTGSDTDRTNITRESGDSNRTEDRQRSVSKAKQAWEESESRSSSSAVSSDTQRPVTAGTSRSGVKSRLPVESWQVSRRHLSLTAEEISSLGGGKDGGGGSHSGQEIRRRFGTQPWMPRDYAVNSFKNRFSAQQDAIKEQQRQIKEQQRMIEELQSEQRQQAYRECLKTGADSKHILQGNMTGDASPPGKGIPRDHEKADSVRTPSSIRDNTRAASKAHSDDGLLTESFSKKGPLSRTNVSIEHSDFSAATKTSAATSVASKRVPPNNKYLQVLKNMDERAAERARLKAEREERRRIQEDQKLAQMEAEALRKQQEEEEEKKAKAEAYRAKKRLEKQKEEERQARKQKEEQQTQMAEEHRLRALMKYRGLLPFKKLISQTKRNWSRAVKHRDREVLRQCLRTWRSGVEEEIERKNALADEMKEFLLIKHSFQKWRNFKHHQEFLERRAERHHNHCVKVKCLQAWVTFVSVEKAEMKELEEMAVEHHRRYTMKSVLRAWHFLPQYLKKEEERKKRKLELRQKVAQLIPDFSPEQSLLFNKSQEHIG